MDEPCHALQLPVGRGGSDRQEHLRGGLEVVINQLEGGFVQAASWSLKEQVLFDQTGSISRNWDSYPILNFSEVPTIATVVLDQPGSPSLGAGEASTGPTPAAIANAIYHATGIRIREVPFLPDQLRRLALSL